MSQSIKSIVHETLSETMRRFGFELMYSSLDIAVNKVDEKYIELTDGYKASSMKTNKNMLDRHKIASCLCGAVIKAKPFKRPREIYETDASSRYEFKYYPNELAAFMSGYAVIEDFMFDDIIKSYTTSDDINTLQSLVYSLYPYFPSSTKEDRSFLNSMLIGLKKELDIFILHSNFHYNITTYAALYFILEQSFKSCVNEKYQNITDGAKAFDIHVPDLFGRGITM